MMTMQELVMTELRAALDRANLMSIVQWDYSNTGRVYPHGLKPGRYISVNFQSDYCTLLVRNGRDDIGPREGHFVRYHEGHVPAVIADVVRLVKAEAARGGDHA